MQQIQQILQRKFVVYWPRSNLDCYFLTIYIHLLRRCRVFIKACKASPYGFCDNIFAEAR